MTNGSLMIEGKCNVTVIFRTWDHRQKLFIDGTMVSLGDTSDLEDSGNNE
jgi:hypothetical protein